MATQQADIAAAPSEPALLASIDGRKPRCPSGSRQARMRVAEGPPSGRGEGALPGPRTRLAALGRGGSNPGEGVAARGSGPPSSGG